MMRRLETIGADGDQEIVEAVLGGDAVLQPSGGGPISPHPPTSLPHMTPDRPAATHHATLPPSPIIMGHADVPPVSASPPGPCGSSASHAPVTSEAGGSGTMDSESQVVCDVVLGLMAPRGAEVEQMLQTQRSHTVPYRVPIHVQPISDEVPIGDMTRGDVEEPGGHGAEGKSRADLHTTGSASDTQVVVAYEERAGVVDPLPDTPTGHDGCPGV
ncbi:hypothetical protein CBR_g34748 [Chara braunii]|uniref:Uncharacterized protein n=1 Tax=Chara braunii TaxID=69332 RepID=A0A388LJE9_CHABU|nr:hypothetical protein CBR_g34748 [Chara braunii]|eukprot:GBG82373.1 hypothetical protein CBR_g34748 [Chara braunii]